MELSNIINSDLFKDTTDTLSGNRVPVFESGTLTYKTEDTYIKPVAYGSMGISNNINSQTLLEADLATASGYVKLVNFQQELQSNVTFSDNSLNISVDGVYRITFWCSQSSTGNADHNVSYRYSTNGLNTGLDERQIVVTSDFEGDTRVVSATGFASLTAGDSVSIFVASDKNTTLTVSSAGITVELIQGL
jgi:hypothetical protein